MPVILSQHFLPAERVYEDAEGSLYHYPRQYFTRIQPFDRFVYYRPLGESTRRLDSKTYFGHGVLGVPFADPYRQDHRFVPIIQYEPFSNLVGLKDAQGRYFETETNQPPPSQSAAQSRYRPLPGARRSVRLRFR